MGRGQTDAWWGHIAFASPRRLNLGPLCTQRTPIRKNLGYYLSTCSIIVDHLIDSYCSSNVVPTTRAILLLHSSNPIVLPHDESVANLPPQSKSHLRC